MTAATFAQLPLQVGGVMLAQAGRAALWLATRYMRAPLTHTAITLLVVSTAMAGTNALYGQTVPHPSPMFGAPTAASPVREAAATAQTRAVEVPTPVVVPVAKPQPAPAATASAASDGPVGNADVFEIQRKLEMLKFFTGTIDGVYGPQTAGAIKRFEEATGRKPSGRLTREIVEAIKAAPFSGMPAATPAPEPEAALELEQVAAPAAEPVAEAAPAASATAVPTQTLAQRVPLDVPAPLSVETTGSINRATAEGPTVLGRPVPETPEEALEIAATTAGEAIETIIAGVTTMAMTKPGERSSEASSYADDGASLSATELAAVPEGPRVGVPLPEASAPPPGTPIAVLDTLATPEELVAVSVTDPVVVARVQRGLASLGFLHGPADGIAGEATAKAIRNFETYFNYQTTGRISPELLDLLIENGAAI